MSNGRAWTRKSGSPKYNHDPSYHQPRMEYRSGTTNNDELTLELDEVRRPRRHRRSPSVADTFPTESGRARRSSRDNRLHQDCPSDKPATQTSEEGTTRAYGKSPSTYTRTHRARSSGRPSSPARVSNPRPSSRKATRSRETTGSTPEVPSTETVPNFRPSRSARAETSLSGGGGHHKDRSGDSCFFACCIISSALCGCSGGSNGGGGGGE